jgi:hypothetical protein
MARTALKILLGFLSTAVFFAAFALIGDVLLAAVAAVTVVIAQVVFGRTTGARPSAAIWASLALVLALTGVTLAGDDTASASLAFPAEFTGSVSNCACKPGSKPGNVSLPPHSSLKALAPAPRVV